MTSENNKNQQPEVPENIQHPQSVPAQDPMLGESMVQQAQQDAIRAIQQAEQIHPQAAAHPDLEHALRTILQRLRDTVNDLETLLNAPR